MLDILFLAVVSYYMWKGYNQGVVKVLGGFICLLLAYFSAYAFNAPVAAWFEASSSLKGPFLYAVSGAALFFSVLVLGNLLFWLLRKLLQRRGMEPSKSNGMLAGMLVGCVFGAVVVWLGGIIDSTIALKTGHKDQGETAVHAGPDIHKFVSGLVAEGIESTLRRRMPEESAVPKLAGELARDPVSFAVDMRAISSNRSLRELYANPQTRSLLETGNTEALLHTEEYQAFINNPDTLRLAERMFDGKPPEARKTAFTESLARISRGAALVQGDPRFQALMQDPEIRRVLENPGRVSPVTLLTNPKVNELVELIMEAADSSPYGENVDRSALMSLQKPQWQTEADRIDEAAEEPGKTRIYRWKDENGRVNYSENKPEGIDDYQIMGD